MGGINGKTILLVEDDEVVQRITERCLQHMGLNVVTAGDGREALQLLIDTSVDAILSDVHMPIMSGLELVDALPAAERRKVLLCSGALVGLESYSGVPIHPKPIGYKRLRQLLKDVFTH